MMAKTAVLVLLGMALLGNAGAERHLKQAKTTVRYCIPVQVESGFVDKCNTAISLADTDSLDFTCVENGTPEGCIDAIANGNADITTLGAAEQPLAKDKNVIPIVAESYGGDTLAEYFPVAVVQASTCTANSKLSDLKGKKACHTGFRKTSGWNIPVGRLVSEGIMEVKEEEGVTADASSVANFFSEVCAPRTTADGPRTGGQKWDPLCTACGGDCSTEDPYYDYKGTLRGLMEGACDVAFTKQDIVPIYAADGSEPEAWATMKQADFRLLCPSGGCVEVDKYENCNLGKVPSKAFLALESNSNNDAIADALVKASSDSVFLSQATEIDEVENVILSGSTEALLRVDVPFNEFFEPATLAAFNKIRSLEEGGSANDDDDGGASDDDDDGDDGGASDDDANDDGTNTPSDDEGDSDSAVSQMAVPVVLGLAILGLTL